METRESGNNHRYAVVGKIWQLEFPWWNKTSQGRLGSQKSFTLAVPWNLAEICEVDHGIIEKKNVDTLPFKKIWDCWMAVCWIEVKSFAFLLQSTNQRSKLVTKNLPFKIKWDSWIAVRWIGRNIRVTVAIDWPLDGGWSPWWIATICEKTPKQRRFNESVESIFYMVRWNEYHFSAAFNLLKFHQFGRTVLPETLLEYVWYAGGEVWKGTLMVADLEQLDKNRRVRISTT